MATSPRDASAGEHAAMRRALELATKGPLRGPNPQVGCVLLDAQGKIVSEGWHEGAGSPHAEAVALANLSKSGTSAEGLTAVVTLEPCSHTGRTGPCANALIEAGISRVLFSVSDPGDESGGGGKMLTEAGIEVRGGIELEAGEKLLERWLVSTGSQRPWVTVKWAMSLDGRAAAVDGTSQWITSATTRQRVHNDRSAHDAIAVGTKTVIIDDPSLTARKPDGTLFEQQPFAVVVGETSMPSGAKVRNHPGGFLHHQSHDLRQLCGELFELGHRSLYVEGGPTLASAFIKAGLVDEFHITMGALLLGGTKLATTDIGVSTMEEALTLDIQSVTQFDTDVFVIARPHEQGV
jgi:diaminohydroxyphosphoribosylaminopyrimidine deaminase / 5-amino-6-(5-phosphoribosylamino)uracil reductase